MKKFIYAAALAGSMLSMSSCVDLDQDPQSFCHTRPSRRMRKM